MKTMAYKHGKKVYTKEADYSQEIISSQRQRKKCIHLKETSALTWRGHHWADEVARFHAYFCSPCFYSYSCMLLSH